MMAEEEDRLSALPDDIVHQILSCLPMDAVVRTSILSKPWLHQWKFINSIHFSSLPELENEMDYRFLDRCLTLMKAPKIPKFIIFAHFRTHAKPDFANWIDFAISKHVRSLEFYMNVDTEFPLSWFDCTSRVDYFKLPDSFYLKDIKTREEIALSCIHFSPPESELGFRGYQFLRRFFLFDSKISDEVLQLVTSTCPILESLSIIRCWGISSPKISSSALKELVYTKYALAMDMGHIKFEIDAPNLVKLKAYCSLGEISGFNQSCCPLEVILLGEYERRPLDVVGNNYNIQCCQNAMHLLSRLAIVQLFGTNCMFLPLITKALHYNCGPSNTFRSLKEFYFSWRSGIRKAEVVNLLTFLGDCPSLDKIQLEFRWHSHPVRVLPLFPPKKEITCVSEDEDEFSDFEELDDEEEAQLLTANALRHLKTIDFYYYYGTKETTDFVKRLLLKAVCLECLTLFYEPSKHHVWQRPDPECITPPHLKQRFLAQVSVLRRASPCANIRLG